MLFRINIKPMSETPNVVEFQTKHRGVGAFLIFACACVILTLSGIVWAIKGEIERKAQSAEHNATVVSETPVNYLVCYQFRMQNGNMGFGNAAVNIAGKWDDKTISGLSEHIRTQFLTNVSQQVVIISLTKVE